MLHLPEWTPDCWIHLKAGGELTNIIESILKMRKKASEKMVNSADRVAHEVTVELDVINGDSLNKIELNMSTKESAKEVKRRRVERMEKLTNGKALRTMAETHIKRDWMWYGTSMKSTNRIVCWKILSGTLPTKINRTRGRVNRLEKMCRHCGCSAETYLHILAECRKTKEVRSKRHNTVCDKIAKELKLAHPEDAIQRERTWRLGLENLKPDITMINNGKLTFVEVTIQ